MFIKNLRDGCYFMTLKQLIQDKREDIL
ncbi:MAG: DNA polymerase subunit beta, partial [Microcystis sp. Msp_OC_L_20101000_S702]